MTSQPGLAPGAFETDLDGKPIEVRWPGGATWGGLIVKPPRHHPFMGEDITIEHRMEILTSELRRAELAIAMQKFPIPASVPLLTAEGHATSDFLTWMKDGTQWALYVIDNQGVNHPLLRCSARRRILAAGNLHPLFTALIRAREAFGTDIERAQQQTSDFIAMVHGDMHAPSPKDEPTPT